MLTYFQIAILCIVVTLPTQLIFASNSINISNMRVGIVPQQSSKKLLRKWNPLMEILGQEVGIKFKLIKSNNIADFESKLMAGDFDLIYANPLEYVKSHRKMGYSAIAKVKNKKLIGLIVVNKNSGIATLDDLHNTTIAFPKNAFAATNLTQSNLIHKGIAFVPKYFATHDDGYSIVALGNMAAAGGVKRTFSAAIPIVKNKLKILHEFTGVTPHAFATHPRVNRELQQQIQQALISLKNSKMGRKFLKKNKFSELEVAKDGDWDDVRRLFLKH